MQDQFTKADILEGLQHKQFELYYQPILDKKQDRIVSGEALIRWNHPRLGFLHPKSFIRIAEECGIIGDIGDFVFREACRQCKLWKDKGYSFYKISVNVSMAQLGDPKLPQKLFRTLMEEGVEPEDIDIEITESLAMTHPETTKNVLSQLKAFGMRVLLDDFGAGFSSLNHLRFFPVDGIKIDRQFTHQALASDRDKTLLDSVIKLGKALDLVVIAEGVETEEQIELLQALECNVMQGFYFTHALGAREYEEWCLYFIRNPILRV